MATVKVNGVPVEIDNNFSVIQACDSIGATVPRFCYHDFLSVAGNCRMCLVEINGSPKLQVACSTPITDGMSIVTNSPAVLKAQRDVMALILINHPLDCPICDQGGECDLQDQAMAYGSDRSIFEEDKRSVPDKDFGPLVYGYMTRCINCTRCVRFLDEIAGSSDLGGIGRGENVEISTYIDSGIASELSGNLVDVCPVGALVNKPYRGKVRPWELSGYPTIDIMDALGSHISVDIRGAEPIRIRPVRNDDINEVWLSDKGRYIVDGLMRQRIDTPWIRKDGRLQKATWEEAYELMSLSLAGLGRNDIGAIAGDLADVEGMTALKDFMKIYDSDNIDCATDGATNGLNRSSYIFNTTVSGIDDADACLIVGSNPRIESPVLNSRIRKRYLKGNFKIGVIGDNADLTYKYTYLGSTAKALEDIANGVGEFSDVLKQAKKPMIILGQGALTRRDHSSILALAEKIAEKYNMIQNDFNGFSVLQTVASRVGALDIGFRPSKDGKNVAKMLTAVETSDIKFMWLLNADDIDFKKLKKGFVVYIGHHGDKGAEHANVILPSRMWLEKSSTYVNLEGRVQQTNRVLVPLQNSKEDWQIITDFSTYIHKSLPYNTLEGVRNRMAEINPVFNTLDIIEKSVFEPCGIFTNTLDEPITGIIENYYLNNAIARSSVSMAECVETFSKKMKEAV